MIRKTVDEKSASSFESEAQKRQIVRHLFAVRSSLGFSQMDVAKKIGCSQSKVSKLESGLDQDIRLGELTSYLDAVGYDMSLFIRSKEFGSFDQIKFCAFRIRECLDSLVEMAGDDEAIQHGVSKAHLEVLVNMVKLVVDSAKNLPSVDSQIPGVIDPTPGSTEKRDAAPI